MSDEGMREVVRLARRGWTNYQIAIYMQVEVIAVAKALDKHHASCLRGLASAKIVQGFLDYKIGD